MGRFTKEYIVLLGNSLYRCPTCGDRILEPGHCNNPHCPDRINRKRKEEEKKDPFIKLSGEGKKTLTGKPEWCLVPMEAMKGVVRVFESGYVRYGGTRTWLPGIRFSLLFSAMCRHLFGWFYKGHDKDEKSGEHPLCHVIANALMLLTFVDKPKFDDRPETYERVASREEIYAKMVDNASIRDKEGKRNDHT